MGAPDTNIQKQKRRHAGPLIGLSAILVIVLLGFVWWVADEADEPGGAEDAVQTQADPVVDTGANSTSEVAPEVAPEAPQGETVPPGVEEQPEGGN
jgi:hypothetical protein